MKYLLLLSLFLFSYLEGFTTSRIGSKNMASSTQWAFEENKGQVIGEDSALVHHFFRKGNLTMFLLKAGIAYQFEKIHYPEGYKELTKFSDRKDFEAHRKLEKDIRRETYRMDIELIGANKDALILTEGKSLDYVQYFTHDALDVHAYSKIIYRDVYPKIDWVIYQTHDMVKYDFVVHPGGNPNAIKIRTKWVEDLSLHSDGSLELRNRMGQILENAPVTYQEAESGREIVESKFVIEDSIIGFKIENYDPSRDLVIDPLVRGWATYYGGSYYEYGRFTATDKSGNVYLAGQTQSSDVNLASGGHQNYFGGVADAFLVKFDTDGKRLWATYYGGTSSDLGYSCAIDGNNNVYLAGSTGSTNGIGTSNGFQPNKGGGISWNAFLVKFDSLGSRKWGTYYTDKGQGYSCSVDGNDNVFLAGFTTNETGFPYNAFQGTYGGGSGDAFLVKFNSSGARQWATYCGGDGDEKHITCSADPSGNVFLSGSTSSTNNISSGGHQSTNYKDTSLGSDSTDAFLVKYNSNGVRQWGTFYGGIRADYGRGCAADKFGNIYLSGHTLSSNNIAYNGHLMSNPFSTNKIFLAKFNSSGARQWATYYGEDTCSALFSPFRGTTGRGCSTDDSGNVYVCGYNGTDCYTTNVGYNGFKDTSKDVIDAILVKFNGSGTRIWGTFYGSIRWEESYSCSVDKSGHAYLTGFTVDTNRIAYKGFQNANGDARYSDAFLVKFCGRIDTPSVVISSTQGTNICIGSQAKFTAKSVFGGPKPSYVWRKNGSIVGTDSSIFVSSSLSDNDTIECLLRSNASCLFIDSAMSNKIIVKMKSADTTYLNQSSCSNKPVLFNGQNRNTSGVYRDTLVSVGGCDSLIILNLNIDTSSSYSYFYNLNCTPSSYYFNNQNLTTSGVYKDTLVNFKGCDSFITVTLTVNKPTASTVNQSICSNQSYYFNNLFLKTAGIYKDTLINSMGCDSIITLTLVVNQNSSSSFSQSICFGQSYFFNGQNRNKAGQYLDTLVSASGCDSIITLNLSLLTNPSLKNVNVSACNPFIYRGKTYTSSDLVIDTIRSGFGCDSVYVRNQLNLKPIASQTTPSYDTFCDEVTIKNQVYTSSFEYTDTLRTKDQLQCDSIYQPRNITILKTPKVSISSSKGLSIEKREMVHLSASSAKYWFWNTGESTREIGFKILENGTYFVIGWNEEQCRDTASISLIAEDPARLELPTAFSPLSDSFANRVFRPNYYGKIELLKFEIYNRIGEKVYSAYDISSAGWDGVYKGVLQSSGMYSYVIDYRANGQRKFRTGEVFLKR